MSRPAGNSGERDDKKNVNKSEVEWDPSSVPIVGIGASAGGLEAFERFFTNMPSDSGICFLLNPHLDPNHESILGELLMKYTSMNVVQITDGAPIQPDTIFIIPPNKYLSLFNGFLQLTDPPERHGNRMAIDFFFRSISEDLGDKSIGIILSGTGSDGTIGLRSIKERFGMIMVQDPDSSTYNGMLKSAIATGLVDYVLLPEDMLDQLVKFVQQADQTTKTATTQLIDPQEKNLLKIFSILRSRKGHDFSGYKRTTIIRRIERRMLIQRLDSLSHYVKYLHTNADEVDRLNKELLIGVTHFFRDPEAFMFLRDEIIPKIIERKIPEEVIRIWVPGCSTGEEAYSLAILFHECLHRMT